MKQTQSLSDNQLSAIRKLEKLRVGALFMEPGTGKTRITLELIKSSQADFVLFLVPNSTKENIQAEINKWGGIKQDYEIQGILSLSSKTGRLYLELTNLLKQKKKPFMVVDESLLIKNGRAKRTKRIIELGRLCYYRIILNGTPFSKTVQDLWSQMEFLSPKILNMTQQQFKNTFLEYTVHNNGISRREEIIGTRNMDYLYSIIQPYVFDAKLNLEISENEHSVEYDIYDKTGYYKAKEKLLYIISDFDGVQFLAYTQLMEHSYSLDRWHLEALNELLRNIKGKTIIFVKYLDTKAALTELHPECLVLTYGKGALGLNLQEYKNIIFFEKTWDYALVEQAKRRIYRIGQDKNVNYYMMTGDVGLENMMNCNIDSKEEMLNIFKKSSKKEKEELVKRL